MSGQRARRVWGWTTTVAALIVGVAVLWMVTDELVDRRRTAAEEWVVEGLELAARQQSSAAVELAAERKSSTDRSVLRRDRNRRLAFVLVAATLLLVIAAKRYRELGDAQLPNRDQLIQIRSRSADGSKGCSFSERAGDSGAVVAEFDEAFIDELLMREGRDREATIPILQAIQKQYRYLPDEALRRVCEKSDITPAQIAGSATFYAQFRSTPVGRHVVRLCHGTACHVAGVGQIADELRRRLSMGQDEDTDEQMRFTLDPVACLGCCSLAPVMMVGEETAAHLTPSSAWEALSSLEGSS